MKIKTKRMSLARALAQKRPKHSKPQKPWWILGLLIRIISLPELFFTRFNATYQRMDAAGKGPYLILMNHSSFIDMQIAYKIFFPKPFAIVSTTDSFVGKAWLMKLLGCIPTQKYVTDVRLIMDMLHSVRKNKTSVLMFPEAGYSFDGRTTILPRKLGTLVKKMNVPVITVITDGAYLRQPLYNNLRKRKVNVSAHVNCLLTQSEIETLSVQEIDKKIDGAFAFDNFAQQKKAGVRITEPHRAEGLERILYRCPACNSEGKTVGKGETLRCNACGKVYRLTEDGEMRAESGKTEIPHIPHWFDWQRQCVRKELESGQYKLDVGVKEIGLMLDYKALYTVGAGRLTHDENGFTLTAADGTMLYNQGPLATFSLNADFNWYEIGDIICIGNKDCLYYCFPKDECIVAKARLAAEEMYKLCKKVQNT